LRPLSRPKWVCVACRASGIRAPEHQHDPGFARRPFEHRASNYPFASRAELRPCKACCAGRFLANGGVCPVVPPFWPSPPPPPSPPCRCGPTPPLRGRDPARFWSPWFQRVPPLSIFRSRFSGTPGFFFASGGKKRVPRGPNGVPFLPPESVWVSKPSSVGPTFDRVGRRCLTVLCPRPLLLQELVFFVFVFCSKNLVGPPFFEKCFCFPRSDGHPPGQPKPESPVYSPDERDEPGVSTRPPLPPSTEDSPGWLNNLISRM